MNTLKTLNSETTIILNNKSIYTIDPNYSSNPNKTITYKGTIYYYQGEVTL